MSIPTKTSTFGPTVLNVALSGAIVGGTVATATTIGKVKQGTMTREEALRTVAREAGTTGAATGAAAAVVGALGLSGLVSLVGLTLVATGTKYALNQTFAPKPLAAEAPAAAPASEKPAVAKAAKKPVAKKPAKKTAPKKTATKKATAQSADKPADADK